MIVKKHLQTNNMSSWRMLRNRVKIAIDKAKIFYNANRVRNLQKYQPRKWYQQFRKITNTAEKQIAGSQGYKAPLWGHGAKATWRGHGITHCRLSNSEANDVLKTLKS